jgi:hypothetical protein
MRVWSIFVRLTARAQSFAPKWRGRLCARSRFDHIGMKAALSPAGRNNRLVKTSIAARFLASPDGDPVKEAPAPDTREIRHQSLIRFR